MSYSTQYSDEVIALLEQGQSFSKRGKSRQAFDAYKEATRIDPRCGAAYANLAAIYAKSGDEEKALSLIERALAVEPNLPVYQNRARLLAKQDTEVARTQAIADYSKAIRREPANARYYLERGNLYHLQHQYEAAITDLDRAVWLNPRLTRAYLIRGTVYGSTGDHERALADMEVVLKRDPKHPEPHFYRGLALAEQGDRRGAIREMERAVKLAPKHEDAPFWRENIAALKKQQHPALGRGAAAPSASGAYRLPPRFQQMVEKSDTLAHQGNIKQALALLDDVRRRAPQNPTMSSEDRRFFNALHQKLYDVIETMSIRLDMELYYLERGMIYQYLGLHGEALVYFKRFLDISTYGLAFNDAVGKLVDHSQRRL